MRFFPRACGALSVLLFSSLGLEAGHAATFHVTEPTDAFGGDVCTLRNAIEAINTAADFSGCVNAGPDAYGTNDTITLTGQTYTLSVEGGNGEDANEEGDLDIRNSLTLIGAGISTAISAAGFADGDEDRVIHIVEPISGDGGGGPSITVNIQDLTIRDGDTSSGGGQGGGLNTIVENALVTLTNVIVTENIAGGDGGGLANRDGFLRVENSLVSDNETSSDGGALKNNQGSLTVISNSTIDRNSSTDEGGGIHNLGTLLVFNSTISRNSCVDEEEGNITGDGGGIDNEESMILVNSTISGNEAGFTGGGIADNTTLPSGVGEIFRVMLFNNTIADNTVLSDNGLGGGICASCLIVPNGTVDSDFALYNTLVAQNEAANFPDCGGEFFSGGFNLIGDSDGSLGFTATGDQLDVANAGLGPLQDNGGPTETHALLVGSPAIDRANDIEGCQAVDAESLLAQGPLAVTVLSADQRDFPRPIAILDPAAAICDIGAYEFQIVEPTPTPSPTPTPPVPPLTGFVEGSGCSLHTTASGPASASLWMMLSLAGVFYGLKKSQARN